MLGRHGLASGYTVEQIKQFIQSAIQLKNPGQGSRRNFAQDEAVGAPGSGHRGNAARRGRRSQDRGRAEGAGDRIGQPAARRSRLPRSPSMCLRRRLLPKSRPSCWTRCATTPSIIRSGCPISSAWSRPAAMSIPPAGNPWRQADVITARLSYFNQKEDYKLVSQNDKRDHRRRHTPRWAAPCRWAISAPPCAISSTPRAMPASNGSDGPPCASAARTSSLSACRWNSRRYTIEYQGEDKDDIAAESRWAIMARSSWIGT